MKDTSNGTVDVEKLGRRRIDASVRHNMECNNNRKICDAAQEFRVNVIYLVRVGSGANRLKCDLETTKERVNITCESQGIPWAINIRAID